MTAMAFAIPPGKSRTEPPQPGITDAAVLAFGSEAGEPTQSAACHATLPHLRKHPAKVAVLVVLVLATLALIRLER